MYQSKCSVYHMEIKYAIVKKTVDVNRNTCAKFVWICSISRQCSTKALNTKLWRPERKRDENSRKETAEWNNLTQYISLNFP
jgi:hypothetical protein